MFVAHWLPARATNIPPNSPLSLCTLPPVTGGEGVGPGSVGCWIVTICQKPNDQCSWRGERKGRVRESGRGAKLNMCPGVTGTRINAESLYLPSEETHPASPTHMALANKWLTLACAVTR